VAAPEPAEGDARPPRATVRARARAPAGGAVGAAALADRRRRARGEDPHVQLPGEPAHGSPGQAHGAPARPRAPGRARRVHRRPDRRRAPTRTRVTRAREALRDAERWLERAGVDSPRVDAELLVAHVVGVSRTGPYAAPERDVDADALERLLVRREAREPLAYVLGEGGFRRLKLRTE